MTVESGVTATGEKRSDDAPAGEALGRQAGRGLRWSLLGTMAVKLGSFAMGLVLARLLVPEDFGMYAIALAATQFVMHIKDVGLIAATVQWRGRLEDMAPTATTMAFLFSIAIYAVFFTAAPWYTTLAHSPEATPIVRILTAIILIEGVTAVRVAALLRTFRQGTLTVANLAGLAVNAAVAIAMAADGAGAYSFVVGQLAGWIVTGVIVMAAVRMPFRFGFSRPIARQLMRFGVPLAASLGVEAFLMNADYVIVGHALGTVAVGYYLLAFNVSSWAQGIIGTAVRYVSVPVFSRLSEGGQRELSDGVNKSVPLLVTILIPIAVLASALASPLVIFLYGHEWAPAVAALRFLMILTVVRILTSFALDILTGAGATKSALWANLGWAIALIPALWVSTYAGGIRGTAIGHAVVGVVVAMPLFGFALHRVGVRLSTMVLPILRPVIGGLVAGIVAWVASHHTSHNSLLELAVGGSLGLIAYVVVALTPVQWRSLLGRFRRREATDVAVG